MVFALLRITVELSEELEIERTKQSELETSFLDKIAFMEDVYEKEKHNFDRYVPTVFFNVMQSMLIVVLIFLMLVVRTRSFKKKSTRTTTSWCPSATSPCWSTR